MAVTDLAVVTQAGEQIFVTKLLLTAVQWLWLYDYLLTLGDEIQYAWSGKWSWAFLLFIANRYNPLVHFIWVQTTMFGYNTPFCEATKWVAAYHSDVGAVLAHITVALRVYAITGKNKLLGWVLALAVSAEVGDTIFCIIWMAFVPLQPIPDINLDVFKICLYEVWKPVQLIYYALAMAIDLIVFSAVVFTVRKSKRGRYPTIPSILDTIQRDAMHYFMLIFSTHILSLLFLFLAPENIQLLPTVANTTFVPLMASRLMLSLKKAAVEPKRVWSLSTITDPFSWRPVRVSRVPDGLHETPPRATTPDGKDGELGVALWSPQHRGSLLQER